MPCIAGVGVTRFGRLPGLDALGWQGTAALMALDDAGARPSEVDALIVGYATTLHHLMPADVLAEQLGVRPRIAYGASAGGATGAAMIAAAVRLAAAGQAETVLVVAGEDRASGQTTDTSIRALAQVGHREYEAPIGANVPAYYALLASHYLSRHGIGADALSPLAVQMRTHASRHPGAHLATPITVSDVRTSAPVADPLRLLDCCPISDGGAAVVVRQRPAGPRSVEITGVGEAHHHQHLSEADLDDSGAGDSSRSALKRAGRRLSDIRVAGIYDSFTITLALLLEEIGISEPGCSGSDAAKGRFDLAGEMPLNTHGGLLSYGHCGVAGGLAHLAELVSQLRGEAGARQVSANPRVGLLHADGGVMSAHVSLVLEV